MFLKTSVSQTNTPKDLSSEEKVYQQKAFFGIIE